MEEPGRLHSMGSLESDTTERLPFHFSLSYTEFHAIHCMEWLVKKGSGGRLGVMRATDQGCTRGNHSTQSGVAKEDEYGSKEASQWA